MRRNRLNIYTCMARDNHIATSGQSVKEAPARVPWAAKPTSNRSTGNCWTSNACSRKLYRHRHAAACDTLYFEFIHKRRDTNTHDIMIVHSSANFHNYASHHCLERFTLDQCSVYNPSHSGDRLLYLETVYDKRSIGRHSTTYITIMG